MDINLVCTLIECKNARMKVNPYSNVDIFWLELEAFAFGKNPLYGCGKGFVQGKTKQTRAKEGKPPHSSQVTIKLIHYQSVASSVEELFLCTFSNFHANKFWISQMANYFCDKISNFCCVRQSKGQMSQSERSKYLKHCTNHKWSFGLVVLQEVGAVQWPIKWP